MTDIISRPAVLLDIDDTLLDFGRAEAIALSRALRELGLEPDEGIISRYSRINASQWELLEQGMLEREQVLVRRFDILFDELGVELNGSEAKELYEGYLGIGHYFMPGAEELLERLYGDYELYIVSNGTAAVQDARIKSAGIGKYFEDIFISEHMGCNKPSPEFFRACFSRMKAPNTERMIIVGDSLTSDIRGGINAGIKTCWYNPKNKPGRPGIKADYEIKELAQLPGLLEKIF